MNNADIIVVGNGIAGLTAAVASAQQGKKVYLLTRGAGTITVAGGCVDVLGYYNDTLISGSPFDYFSSLPEYHPYSFTGEQTVRQALKFFTDTCHTAGLILRSVDDANVLVPTVLGSLRPSFLSSTSINFQALPAVILVVGIEGVKDCRAEVAADAFSRHPRFSGSSIKTITLTNPFGVPHRNTNPLDLAWFLDTPQGQEWLVSSLRPYTTTEAAVFIPPILGVEHHSHVLHLLTAETGMEFVEMASLPPGVGGLRIYTAYRKVLNTLGVEIAENCTITGAAHANGQCERLTSFNAGHTRSFAADSYIIATGGLLGGGIATTPAQASEAIFSLPVVTPPTVMDWTTEDIFSRQPYATLGVKTDRSLRPVDEHGNILLANVRFAGRSLAGYDLVTEKSGFGVAIATGYHAAMESCLAANESCVTRNNAPVQ